MYNLWASGCVVMCVSSRGRSSEGADASALAHYGGGKHCQVAEERRWVLDLCVCVCVCEHVTSLKLSCVNKTVCVCAMYERIIESDWKLKV